MYRIFKKKGDLAARGAEARARRPRLQRPGLEALESRQLLTLTSPQDFLVNITTRNAQFSSDNATAANGRSVAVWVDEFSPDADDDIRAQMYNAAGLRVGPEIVVENSTLNQSRPQVAMDADGDFIVTYVESNNSQLDIFAQRFNSNGAKVGGRIAVADSPKDEFDPDVAMDADGNFVVSYTEQFGLNDRDIRAVRYGSSGVRVGFVDQTSMRTSDHDETKSSVAMSPDGRFDIAYQTRSHSGGPTALNLARYDRVPFGTKLADGPIRQANSFPVFGENPSVAMDNAGNAVVAWDRSTTGGPGTGPPPQAVEAIRVSSSGSFGDVNLVGGFVAFRPSVALSPTGGSYVVAYDSGNTVAVTEVNASDNTVFSVNLPASPHNSNTAVSMAPGGKYFLTFDAGFGSATVDVHGRRGSFIGAPLAKNLALTETVRVGQPATLSGSLEDADGDRDLTLTVSWGDGSPPQQSRPGTKPFKVKHKYAQAGTYTVHATWTDSTGLSNSRDLTIEVTRAR